MNKILCFVLVLFLNQAQAQDLRFKNGEFKIVQFTDIHYQIDKEASLSSLNMIKSTLDSERPDLIVFTGDIVTGKNIAQSWNNILELAISRNIPYLVTLGNHDDEGEWKRQQIADYLMKQKLILNTNSMIDRVSGVLNTSITIKNSSNNNVAVIYAMDSNAYSTIPNLKGYGWFTDSQIEWYKKESLKYKQGIKDTLPALAFFHIPLPEYSYAFNDMQNKRIGVRYENECAPAINTGMFAAMLESGDVMGTFVGHDHVNDYIVNYHGIGLAYGCFSGSSNTYVRTKNGARVIILKEGQRKFETYIREFDGNIVYKTNFPFK